MMRRWSSSSSQKRKTQLEVPMVTLLLLFMVLALCVILYNESTIQQILPEPEDTSVSSSSYAAIAIAPPHHNNHTLFPHNNKPPSPAPVVLDRFSKCSSTVEYSGHKTRQNFPKPELDHQTTNDDTCDLFSGKWVFDNSSHPLYNESDCPYMSDQLACHKHGRIDLGYQYWRWQPHSCSLKRWNVIEMLEKLRGKRLMFVGDSLNRGQWISMVCLLQSVIPADKRSMTPNAELTIFRAEEYNTSVEFLWAPLLVESNSDDPVNHRLDERIIRPDSVAKHSSQWKHADILVFNTYLWWRQGPVKLLWSTESSGVCEEIDGSKGMELAMEAWANWVTTNVIALEKRVFFVTMSPTHQWSGEWKPESEGNCYNEKIPIKDDGYWGSGSDIPTMRMVDRVLRGLGPKVSVINITQLSEYRKDGHPSIYRKFWETLSPQQLSNPATYSDCIHWCLPGVPDVWNELLFQFL